MEFDRQRFLEEGYVIRRQVIPPDRIEELRRVYEILVDRQRAIWARDRAPGDPPGGHWETGAQPRLILTDMAGEIDASTAAAVEIWLHENVQGVSSRLLGVDDAAVTEMMLMCSPVRDHGPARWHRDFSPAHSSSVMGYAEDIRENGPRYVQWNLTLYDDDVLWVVPGSHLRPNTPEEVEQLRRNDRAPLDSGVQTHLAAGDGVAYILPILHWASNYGTRLRRVIHGGYSNFTHYPAPHYIEHLSPAAQATFERWRRRSDLALDHVEAALRAALDGDGPGYHRALEELHPGSGPIFLSKCARDIHNLKRPDFDSLPEAERKFAAMVHPMTLQWGRRLGDRFSDVEAKALWARFEPVDRSMQGDRENSVPGFQGQATRYFFNEVPESLTVDSFIAGWA